MQSEAEPPEQPTAPNTSAPPASPRRPNRLRRWALELALGVGLYLLISHWQSRNLLDPHSDAPDFSLQNLQGEQVRLSDFKGKTVMLHFWATWCGVCRREFGALNSLASGLADDQALLTVVADSTDADKIARFIQAHDLRYPVLLANRSVLKAFNVGAFPTNYFIDKFGKIRSTSVGMSTSWAMRTRMSCAR